MTNAPNSSALFPTPDERISLEHRLTQDLASASQRIAAGRVTPSLDMPAFKEALAGFDFQSPKPLGEVIDWTAAQLERGIVQITHPRYFGLFNPNPTFPAQCADRIVAAFNPQLASSTASPAAVAMEAHVIGAVCWRAAWAWGRMPGGPSHHRQHRGQRHRADLRADLSGNIPDFSGNTERALLRRSAGVLHFARKRTWPGSRSPSKPASGAAGGAPGGDRWPRSHGVPPVWRPPLWRIARTGLVPVMVVATAGLAGMIDPLPDCAARSREHAGAWLHVDAAWGGALVHGFRAASRGRADRDRTRGFGDHRRPQMVRHHDGLRHVPHPPRAGAVGGVPSIDRLHAIQRGERRSVRHLAAMVAPPVPRLAAVPQPGRGRWAGYEAHIEHAIALAAHAKDLLQGKGWKVVNASPLAVLCIIPPHAEVSASSIAERILASGRVWVSVASFEGQQVVRACVTNGETSTDDVDELVQALEEAFRIEAGATSR